MIAPVHRYALKPQPTARTTRRASSATSPAPHALHQTPQDHKVRAVIRDQPATLPTKTSQITASRRIEAGHLIAMQQLRPGGL
jgi:hypothetical protein